jgi:putative resolvase
MKNTYTVGEMAKKLRKRVQTLQRWDREGHLKALRTPTGRRYYTHDQLLAYFGESPKDTPRHVVAYCRVSSAGQRPDLLNQRAAVEAFAAANGYANVEYVDEIGGGLNFKRKHFREIMRRVHAGEITKIIVAHKDRLARFGFEHIEWECNQYGCVVEVLNQQTLSPEQEMVQDLMTIVHCFSSRLYGLRRYRGQIKKAATE